MMQATLQKLRYLSAVFLVLLELLPSLHLVNKVQGTSQQPNLSGYKPAVLRLM